MIPVVITRLFKRIAQVLTCSAHSKSARQK